MIASGYELLCPACNADIYLISVPKFSMAGDSIRLNYTTAFAKDLRVENDDFDLDTIEADLPAAPSDGNFTCCPFCMQLISITDWVDALE
jgi:hypothetical protein